MNVHVRRVAARHRADSIRDFCAALLAALFFGLFLGRASHAQTTGVVVQTCGALAQQYAPGSQRPFAVDINGNQCTTGNSVGAGSGTAGYVSNATPVTVASTGTVSAVTAAIPAAAGKFSYICGFDITIIQNATAAVPTTPTVTGTQATLTYQMVNAVSTTTLLTHAYNPCLPSSAANTAITVTSPADADATTVDINVWGFQQ